jgi:hypothetical protein
LQARWKRVTSRLVAPEAARPIAITSSFTLAPAAA